MSNFKDSDLSYKIDMLLSENDFNQQFGQELSPEVIIQKVRQWISSGESKLKAPLESGQASLMDVIRAIKTERCLCTKERDLGSSYLEQTLSKAIRDCVPIDKINDARAVFGLKPLPPSRLKRYIQSTYRHIPPNTPM